MSQELPPDLVEQVLAKLGLSNRPPATLAGLHMIYGAWCRAVPFDNVLKLIHVNANNPEPLPGGDAIAFFQNWLRYGTGGTCWSGNGALYALLDWLGFNASRGVATMMVVPELPPNHGTVIVVCDDNSYIVDASIQHGAPVRLEEQAPSAVIHPAWGVRVHKREGLWHVWWRPLNRLEGLECRINYVPATLEEFHTRYENTRLWSPFNYELTVRKSRQDSVMGITLGQRVEIDSTGSTSQVNLEKADRLEFLQELGYNEEIIAKLPLDRPTPPPPWSESAQQTLSR